MGALTVCQTKDGPQTLPEVLADAARRTPGVEAYVEPATEGQVRRALTFAGLFEASTGAAGLLARHGVGPGTVVCLLLPSSIDYMVAYAASARLGAVTSGINLRLGAREVTSILDRTRPTVTILDDELPVPVGPIGVVIRRSQLEQAAGDGQGGPREWPELHPSDPVAVVWTSGTTGLPKGAVFDHRCLGAVAQGTDVLSAAGDRRLSPLPFAHVGSMTRLWDEAVHSVTTVITPTPWTAADQISVLVTERITVAQGVPTQWALVLARPELAKADVSSLRIAGTGASPVPTELVAAMRASLGVPVVVRYTSTEASLGTGTVPGDPDEAVATTVGRPVPGVEIEIADDDGKAVVEGQVGRVRLRSPAVMRGYWGGPLSGPGAAGVNFDVAATEGVLDGEGWLTTGDFGRLDADGRLVLVGRANELYIRGGYNVYPAEVEAVIGEMPEVDSVAVVGAPDPVLGQIGVAFVVLVGRGSEAVGTVLRDEIRSRAAGRIADYKMPDRVVVVDALPLTSMMKVDKRELAGRAARILTGEDGP